MLPVIINVFFLLDAFFLFFCTKIFFFCLFNLWWENMKWLFGSLVIRHRNSCWKVVMCNIYSLNQQLCNEWCKLILLLILCPIKIETPENQTWTFSKLFSWYRPENSFKFKKINKKIVFFSCSVKLKLDPLYFTVFILKYGTTKFLDFSWICIKYRFSLQLQAGFFLSWCPPALFGVQYFQKTLFKRSD